MKLITYTLILLVVSCLHGFAQTQTTVLAKDITSKQHPRILLLKGEERLIEQSVSTNPVWKKMHEAILKECDHIVALPPIERIQIGADLVGMSQGKRNRGCPNIGRDGQCRLCAKPSAAYGRSGASPSATPHNRNIGRRDGSRSPILPESGHRD